MTVVGLVAHPERPKALDLARSIAAELAEAKVEVRLTTADAMAAGLEEHAVPEDQFAPGLDFAVSLGGDGTILRTVDLVYEEQIPVLGVNLGQLGFLTDVEPGDVDSAVKRVLAGDFGIEERMVARVTVESSSSAAGSWWALNECLLEKARTGRLIRLSVSIAGEFFTTYAADGIIVATPTGSTAYAFSARGPIVSPELRCLLLIPVSPHMLFDRALVLHPQEDVHFDVQGEPPVELSIDGRTLGQLTAGDAVTCRAGEWPARLIVFERRHFHRMLKVKFQLPDR